MIHVTLENLETLLYADDEPIILANDDCWESCKISELTAKELQNKDPAGFWLVKEIPKIIPGFKGDHWLGRFILESQSPILRVRQINP